MQQSAHEFDWIDANQAFLVAEFARLKSLLGDKSETEVVAADAGIRREMDAAPAIDWLTRLFGLSEFERDTLLLCAGVEMDARLAALCADAAGRTQRGYATFGLATAVLPAPHWSALAPARPLRRFRLVELDASQGLTTAALRIDERILHYLAGINALDRRLQPLLQTSPASDWIAATHERVANTAARVLEARGGDAPVMQLCGDDPQGQEDVAAFAAQALGCRLFVLPVEDIPAPGAELNQFVTLWERESRLLSGTLLIQCSSGGFPAAARHLAERLPAPLFLASREPLRLRRPFLRIEVEKPPPAEQKQLWARALGPAASKLNGTLDNLAQHFRLSAKTIHATSMLSHDIEPDRMATEDDASAIVAQPSQPRELWNACRALARPRLEDLAQRIVPSAGWEDLILPEPQTLILRQLVDQVRHRMKVHESWGFSDKGRRGLGVSALFAGGSGTGKTLAAEVLARDLDLDLYRIDLSAVVSKYIGETEKNLRQVFDAAEEGGVLLLFDEADALFGKRGEVKDSHDRYANIEVGYLLQRMETYQGLAVLTTNLKSTMDKAFQRRLRFIVNFPFPDAAQREAIWSRVFPVKTPTEGLEAKRLAQLNVAGGNIRNIALNAAFLAATAKKPVGMEHLLEAARLESQKIERPLSDAEIRGWV
jgi:hypothetical protein